MDYYEIVTKLIGNIAPVGESTEDTKRFENLKNLTDLVDKLITYLDDVEYCNKNSHEFSVKRAAEHISKFFDKLGIEE